MKKGNNMILPSRRFVDQILVGVGADGPHTSGASYHLIIYNPASHGRQKPSRAAT
jgi:hypothetical protein